MQKQWTLGRDFRAELEVMAMVKDLTFDDLGEMPDPGAVASAGMEQIHTTVPLVVACPECGLDETRKYGIRAEHQEYVCTSCGRKFNLKGAPKGMRTPAKVIGAALAMFYDGLSLADVSRHLEQSHDTYVNPSSIYRWIQRYTKEAVRNFRFQKVKTGPIWAADETVLTVIGGSTKTKDPNSAWFWDVIDEDTKFLLASHLSLTRTTRDAETLFERARDKAFNAPRFIVTDKLAAYIDGIERVFGAESRHIQSKGMATSTHNNVIERFHGTIKERTKVMRGLKSRESAKLIMDGWAIHYNYFRPHMSLQGKTPAEAAGVRPTCETWIDLVLGRGCLSPALLQMLDDPSITENPFLRNILSTSNPSK
jgi:transposase-like protein/predicted RNA-binding Zn-ribbon protein involved in translation (DUF1610 family)